MMILRPAFFFTNIVVYINQRRYQATIPDRIEAAQSSMISFDKLGNFIWRSKHLFQTLTMILWELQLHMIQAVFMVLIKANNYKI